MFHRLYGSEAVVTERTKITLDESEIPRQWYNVIPDLPAPPPPPLHPGTGQPVGPEDLAPLFPMELIRQEVATDSYIDIPAEVLRLEKLGATVVNRLERWVVMQAPTGQRFCVVRVQRPGFPKNANRWD